MSDLLHVRDFIGPQTFTPSGKKTELFSANLIKGGAVLPYFHHGKLVWMSKPRDHWLTDSVAEQLTNLVVTREHQPHESSHSAAIGLIKGAKPAGDFLAGDVAIFGPEALEAIASGIVQLSPDAMVQLEPVGREVDGVWVDFAQHFPTLDHMALLLEGRHGADLELQRLSDSFPAGALELDLSTLQKITAIQLGGTKMTLEEQLAAAQAELVESQTALGTATAELTAIKDENARLSAENEALQGKVSEIPDQAAILAQAEEALQLYESASGFIASDSFTLIGCLTQRPAMLRLVQQTLAPTAQISDATLGPFCQGLLAATPKKAANNIRATAPAAPTTPAPGTPGTPAAPAAPAAPAQPVNIADGIQTDVQVTVEGTEGYPRPVNPFAGIPGYNKQGMLA
jgi:cell division protein FtsB